MEIIICGCFGKMGREVFKTALTRENTKIVAGIDRNVKKFGNVIKDSENFYVAPVFENASQVNIKCDVIIDFSSPTALDSLLEFAKKNSIALVICATGYTQEQCDLIHEFSKNVPVFMSSNTSLAVNLLIKLAKISKQILGNEFDIEIIEKHHNQKVDAPSGTAMMMAKSLSEKNTELVFNRTNIEGKRNSNEIGIHCIRGGTIKGEHEIIFAGLGECFTLKHVAESREIFARGALSAAEFIKSKSSGFYTMTDLMDCL
jgi:4-hydroxy-tetrahydrodipicolinate reductase